MLEKIKSLKCSAAIEKIDGGGFGFIVLFENIKVKHPFHKYDVKQPSFIITLRFLFWDFYMMVYKPAKIPLNRAERRALHMK